jgi:hypothetical protein
MDSAIHFHDFGLGVSGMPLSATRMSELRGPVGSPNKPYNAIIRRDKWVDYLNKQQHDSGLSDDMIDALFEWATTTRIAPSRVETWTKKLCLATVSDVA